MTTDELPAPFGPGFAQDIHARLAGLRERCPVTQVLTRSGEPVWLVLDHADVSRCLIDPRLSVQRGDPPVRKPGQRASAIGLMNYEPPDHTRIRRLSNAAFTDRRLRGLRPAIEAILATLLQLAEQSPGPVEVLAQVAKPFTFGVLCEVFGINPDARQELQRQMTQVFERRRSSAAETEANVDRIEAVIRAELRDCQHQHREDALHQIRQAWRADGGLDEAELVSLVMMLLLAGFDSTAQMIGLCVVALAEQPELRARLRAEPQLAPAAVEELLRWDTSGPFSTPRWAREDVEVAGTVIPRGSQVIMSFLAANHDPRLFPDATRIDIDRRPAKRNLAFGHGAHFCPGSALARIELTVAVTELARRYPDLRLAVAADQLPWGGQHQQRTLACLPVLLGTSQAA